MLVFEIALTLIVVFFAYILYRSRSKTKTLPGYKTVPRVKEGYYPIVGNGITFGKDIIGLVKKAQATYGDVFRLKIFRKDIIVICDHNLKDEYFKAVEADMSLYDVLNQLFFGSAFTDNEDDLSLIIKFVKKTIKINFDVFSSKIMDEANSMITRLKNKQGVELDLSKEMIRFIACTSARCFIGMELHDEFYNTLMEFAQLLNHIVVLTYFLPRSVLRWWYGAKLKKY